jgi:hypothetical protein
MRDLLRDRADRGGTVLLSSHLLREVEVVADDIVMIGNGQIVSHGSKTELLQAAGSLVRTPQEHALRQALDAAGIQSTPTVTGHYAHRRSELGRAESPWAQVWLSQSYAPPTAGSRRCSSHSPQTPNGRESSMTTVRLDRVHEKPPEVQIVPLSRVVGVELRKMLDTRAGLWLMASILITALSPRPRRSCSPRSPTSPTTHSPRPSAFPMTVILPIIAILAITGEWSQRTGLTTFTLVPNRTRVITAKVVASILVGVASMLIALVFGVAGNMIGPAITGTDRVWDVSFIHGLDIILGSLISLLLGTMLGILFRSTPVALVAYFVTSFLMPTMFGLLATNQEGFRNQRRWVDLNYAQSFLFEGTLSGVQWARLAVATTLWLILPALLGLRLVMKSEVK